MAVLSATNKANVFIQGNPNIVRVQSTAGTYYKGGLLCYDLSNGTVINGVSAAWAAGDIFAGFCDEDKVTTTADPYLSMVVGGIVHLYAPIPGLADCSKTVFIDITLNSDNPGDIEVETSALANDIPIGRLLWSDGDQQVVNTADRFLAVVGA